jgi:hypothetical protein
MTPQQIIEHFTDPELKSLSTTTPVLSSTTTHTSTTAHESTSTYYNDEDAVEEPQTTPSCAISNRTAENPSPSSNNTRLDSDTEVSAGVRLCEA